MTQMQAQRDAFGKALVELGARDERVVCLDADLASSSKMILFAEAYPERFFQMGIAEANMTSAAAGLAAMGFVPFTNSFAVFATLRSADQIRVSIAQPDLPVKIAGAYSGLLAGKTGKTHQAIEDIALMRAMPNMTVVSPGDGVEMGKAVHAVAAWDGPVYLRGTRDPSPVCSRGRPVRDRTRGDRARGHRRDRAHHGITGRPRRGGRRPARRRGHLGAPRPPPHR